MKNIFKTFPYFLILMIPVCFLCGCSKDPAPAESEKALHLLSETILPFGEPSGIAYSISINVLWIVSGSDQHIYMVDTSGAVLRRLLFSGTDLEGITFDETDSSLWVVDEATKEIIHLDLDGGVLLRKRIIYSTLLENKGPEGISIGPEHHLYIINERNPSIILTLKFTGEISSIDTIGFASDYSDISYTGENDTFLIISDESKALFFWSLTGGISRRYALSQEHNEGVAFDRTRNTIYIVNDATSAIQRYILR